MFISRNNYENILIMIIILKANNSDSIYNHDAYGKDHDKDVIV